MLRKYSLRDFNFKLCIFLLVLSTLGVLLVGSADSTLQTKQMLGVIGGFVIMLVIAFFDYSWVLHFAWVIYALNLIRPEMQCGRIETCFDPQGLKCGCG